MDHIKAELQALQAAQQSSEQGWTWFFDEANGVICAQKGNTVRRVFMSHIESTDPHGHPTALTLSDARLIAQTLNSMPKVLEALERTVSFAEGLEEMAEMREPAAHSARREERYDVSELHRQSAKRVRTTKEAFLEEVRAAFANSKAMAEIPDPETDIPDNK
jgi:hypothetical protein